MNNEPQTPSKSSNSTMMWVVLIVILTIAAVGIYLWWQNSQTNTNTAGNENVNKILNVNSGVNANTNTAGNTNLPTNTNTVDTSGWETYANSEFLFSIQYPSEFTRWETKLSSEVAGQRTDGLLFDVGFRPVGLQGSILVVRVFSKSLEVATLANPSEHGTLTSESIDLNGVSALKMTGNARRYGVRGKNYSYIIEVNNYRNESDLNMFDKMLRTFHLDE